MSNDYEEYKFLPISPDFTMREAGNKAIDKIRKDPTRGLADQAFYCYQAMVEACVDTTLTLSTDDLNLIRQWYCSVVDVNRNFLDGKDAALYSKIMTALEMKVSPRDIDFDSNPKKES